MNLKVFSDGTTMGTRVYDMDNNRQLENITKLEIIIDKNHVVVDGYANIDGFVYHVNQIQLGECK